MEYLNPESDPWFPDCAGSSSPPWVLDARYRDFDEQAERLAGLDQEYLQLTPGAFRGRFLSAFLGNDASVHIERCNQALEQCVTGSPGHFCIGVVLSDEASFRVNGKSLGRHDVLIAAPNAAIHLYSPAGGAVMAIVVERERLLNNPGLTPAAADTLHQMGSGTNVIHAPEFASRMREIAIQSVETSLFFSESAPVLVGDTLIELIASALTLESHTTTSDVRSSGNLFVHFDRYRKLVHDQWGSISRISAFSEISGTSKRSLEHAFSTSLAIGPLTYVRLVRLHLARSSLLSSASEELSIGDIAANHGFWNWSRFTHQYRKQFGELPSETRTRIKLQ